MKIKNFKKKYLKVGRLLIANETNELQDTILGDVLGIQPIFYQLFLGQYLEPITICLDMDHSQHLTKTKQFRHEVCKLYLARNKNIKPLENKNWIFNIIYLLAY